MPQLLKVDRNKPPAPRYIPFVEVRYVDAKTQFRQILLGKQYGEKNVGSVSHISLDEQQSISATPSELKHEKVVNYLTNKITRIKNRPKVTQQDVHKAVERYKTRQKRANLELEKQQELQQARDK